MNLLKKVYSCFYRYYFQFKRSNINKNVYDVTMSLHLPLYLPNIENYDMDLFSYNNHCLSVVKPAQLIDPYTQIVCEGKKQIVGIKCWDSNKYKLSHNGTRVFRPLFIDEHEYIYWKNGFLFRKKDESIEKLCSFLLHDFMYCDMLHCGEYYALRSGGIISISKDLRNWKIVYEGKRGIKDSMVFVEVEGSIFLLFIEYSPGVERTRHNIVKYNCGNEQLEVIHTFYTHEEYMEGVGETCARHIHVIAIDPFTNDIYVGTGDNDDESGIFISKDNGNTFFKCISGSQNYRTLSFLFTENYVFWNTDTHESQAIFRMNKSNPKDIIRYPLINGALWCTAKYPLRVDGEDLYIMTSNSEGSLYDNNNRVYGITLKNDEPQIFELLSKRSRTQYTQQFLLGFDDDNNVILFDHEIGCVNSFKLERK